MKIIFAIACLLPLVAAHKHNPYGSLPNKCNAVNGGWGEWSSFGPCSVSCGSGGIQKRHRYCDSPIPKYGGRKCLGDSTEVKPCEGFHECPVDGGWGSWKKGECSKKCGGGVVVFKRHCNSPTPQHCGTPCQGLAIKKEPCNTHYCPVDGEWTPWVCGKCFKHSDGCIKKCKRTCNPPKYDGKPCVGRKVGYKHCSSHQCGTTTTTTTTPRPHYGPCHNCFVKAEEYANNNGKPNFVGHACRVDKSHCDGRNGGIHDMYPANYWFFLHCSPDGPWCKPCATRGLVYNPKCGQCEATRNGDCTGPMKYKNEEYGDMEFFDDDLDNIDHLW